MYFDKCMNINELKPRFILLSKRFHPDLGGSDELMKELLEDYEKKSYEFENQSSKQNPQEKKSKFKRKENSEYSLFDKSYEVKLDTILKWAENNKSFDTGFIESLSDQIGVKDLSSAQEKAIDNIISKFRIPI